MRGKYCWLTDGQCWFGVREKHLCCSRTELMCSTTELGDLIQSSSIISLKGNIQCKPHRWNREIPLKSIFRNFGNHSQFIYIYTLLQKLRCKLNLEKNHTKISNVRCMCTRRQNQHTCYWNISFLYEFYKTSLCLNFCNKIYLRINQGYASFF